MKNGVKVIALAILIQPFLLGASRRAHAQAATGPYPTMAPVDRYLMPEASEIALARSAAPPSVSAGATVMVLTRRGYTTAVKGNNGFVCIVERSWVQSPEKAEFWNPKMRAPNCFNAAAARTFLPIDLLKTKLALAGTPRSEIAGKIASAFDNGDLPPLEPGAMCYMMSKQQYLNDGAKNWHPHLMFYEFGNVAKSWGANLPGSPIIASNDPEDRVTVFMTLVRDWSDGTPDLHPPAPPPAAKR